MKKFNHRSLGLVEDKKIIYPAHSKHSFYFSRHISKFVLEQGCVPLNPFLLFDYYMLDTVNRDAFRSANNNLVKIADEIWVFGKIADGVLAEIKLAKQMKKPVKYFEIVNSKKIKEISKENVKFEDGLEKFSDELV